jgi:hypothetical protein
LYCWLRVFGFGILAVRSLGYFLAAAAMLLLWIALRRLGWIIHASWRLAAVTLIATGYGVAYGYRMGRPDPLTIFLVCASLLMLSVRSRGLRLGGLLWMGFLFPWAGLQLAVYAPVLLILVFAFTRGDYLREGGWVLAGESIGAGALMSLYRVHGVLSDFLRSAVGLHTSLGRMTLLYKVQDAKMNFGGFLKDPGFLIFLALALTLARTSARSGIFRWKSFLGFAICSSLFVPVAVFALGIYPIYYSWMAYLPLVICLCASLGQGTPFLVTSRARWLVTTSIVFATLVGLPAFSVLAAARWNERDPAPVEQLAAEALRGEDRALIHYSAYYGVKKHAKEVYFDSVLPNLTADEKSSITVLVIRPEDFFDDVHQLGGAWTDVGKGVHSPAGSGLYGLAHTKIFEMYNLEVYRRAQTPAATALHPGSDCAIGEPRGEGAANRGATARPKGA